MNQRSSHFSLGNTNQTYGSIYTKDYPPKEDLKQVNPKPDFYRTSSLNNN